MALASERVDSLEKLSVKVYETIDGINEGETVARRILRLGMMSVCKTLETSHGVRTAGDSYRALLVRELSHNGLTPEHAVYNSFPSYRRGISDLPRIKPVEADQAILELSNMYADVLRLTLDNAGEFETNASHVVHLSALALPYAAEFHPHLDLSKVALDCLVHDVLEAYAGDVPSLGATVEMIAKKEQDEAVAFDTLASNFGVKYPKFIQCVHDYENLVDDEARFVKTFDKLDPDFTHYHSKGRVLIELLKFTDARMLCEKYDEITERMRPYSGDYPDLMRDRDELNERVIQHTDWPNKYTAIE